MKAIPDMELPGAENSLWSCGLVPGEGIVFRPRPTTNDGIEPKKWAKEKPEAIGLARPP